jgi:hypothetical protein
VSTRCKRAHAGHGVRGLTPDMVYNDVLNAHGAKKPTAAHRCIISTLPFESTIGAGFSS